MKAYATRPKDGMGQFVSSLPSGKKDGRNYVVIFIPQRDLFLTESDF